LPNDDAVALYTGGWALVQVEAVEHFCRAMRLTRLIHFFTECTQVLQQRTSLLAVMTRLLCRHKLLCGGIQMIYRHYLLLQQATRLLGMSQKRPP